MQGSNWRQISFPKPGDGAVRVKFSAPLCYENADEVVETVREVLSQGSNGTLSLDLSETSLIDSSGLRALLQANRTCEKAGVRMRIGPISDAAARVIAMSGLADALGIPNLRFAKTPVRAKTSIDERETGWNVYEYVVTSDASVISDLREKVTRAALEAGAEGDTLCDIQIAVGEALTNAYRHGSPVKGVSRISLRCMTCPKAVVVEIIDEGKKFDPNGTRDPDPKKMRSHGMGLYLMRRAMDVVEITSDCPGNRVRMIKWLS